MNSSRIEQAVEMFNKGFSCSQSIVSTYGPHVGLSGQDALKVSSAFGAGMGRLQETCGALTGAFMVVGCRHGMTEPGDSEAKETTYALVQLIAERFRQEHGAATCRDLVRCDLRTAEGSEEYRSSGRKAEVCIPCVRTAARLLEEFVVRG
ncbi:MAG: C-GCAxxG-C-C family protein [Bacteroidetes bacterium]|jgi:C_GCAxxG_C_C family probable redox protein|nr:C-GCAxxG-C-C family protein [Bacteroidota bacterium]